MHIYVHIHAYTHIHMYRHVYDNWMETEILHRLMGFRGVQA